MTGMPLDEAKKILDIDGKITSESIEKVFMNQLTVRNMGSCLKPTTLKWADPFIFKAKYLEQKKGWSWK
jgi:hypothetical protein